VYAAGDCAEAYHRLLRRGVFLPRGTTANKQGRVAGANAAGGDERFPGVMGTAIAKVFTLEVGHTGLLDIEASEIGCSPVSACVHTPTRGRGYPGGKEISVRLLADGRDRRLLGAQMIGGEGVAQRLDVIVAALSAGLSLGELEGLDLGYSPPFAPVWDPILIAAHELTKRLCR
jgi:NADPH-dependent 2,4-dienoyl-CoA reductase/sulfur reductase-like enzyme